MSPSESSDEEPDFLWLQPTKEERTEDRGRQKVDEIREETTVGKVKGNIGWNLENSEPQNHRFLI